MKRTAVIATILCGVLSIGGYEYSKVFAQDKFVNQVNTVQKVHCLTKKDALNLLNLLLEKNNLTYLYQGNEIKFNALKEKGLSGYIFLPDIDTDMGYFVDKNTKEIYYFHPSGYLELIK